MMAQFRLLCPPGLACFRGPLPRGGRGSRPNGFRGTPGREASLLTGLGYGPYHGTSETKRVAGGAFRGTVWRTLGLKGP